MDAVSLNRDIQAAHYLLQLFERAKSRSEEILDTSPGLFCIIDSKGNVLRGNVRLAEAMKVDHEKLLGHSIKNLFTEKTWPEFEQRMTKLVSGAEGNSEDFELELDGVPPACSYIWNLRSLRLESLGDSPLITVLARDVTELKKLTTQKARMEVELVTAKAVQGTLLPEKIADLGSLRIAGSYNSASECGGDWWYYFRLDGRIILCIGDVVGHGAPAAMLTSAVRSQFSNPQLLEMNLPDIAAHLNRVIIDVTQLKQCMTFLICSFDEKSKVLTMCNAGHVAMVRAPANKELKNRRDLVLATFGPTNYLGHGKDLSFGEKTLQLNSKDRLIFLTDGVFDVMNPEGANLGNRFFYDYLVKALQANPEVTSAVEHLEKSMMDYRKGADLIDDVTFFMVEII